MQQAAAAVPADGAAQHLGERRERAPADVLEHADRDEGVEGPGDVAVVVLDELDAAGEPLARRARSRAQRNCSRDTLNAWTRTP